MMLYLHDNDLHAEDLLLCTGTISYVSKLLHFRRIDLL